MRSEVMTRRTHRPVMGPMVWLVATVALCTMVVGCGGEDGPSCGAGTKLVDGACVPTDGAPSCGAGTVRQDSTCVPIGVDGGSSDTSDTSGGSDVVEDAGPIDCDPTCAATQHCVAGICEPVPVPGTWLCSPSAFADGSTCDCDCGAPDPDCLDAKHPVVGCKSGACQADGTCTTCVPKCDGKTCGPNGCGGSCGVCSDPAKSACIDGTCQACTPQCDGKTCGPDGCGGTCGSCDKGTLCKFGSCAFPTAAESCFGHCGGLAPSGCACTADCADKGNCCADVGTCGCLPKCDGKSCGDDGCGGSCGTCEAGKICTGSACALGICLPSTCNGHGTCKPATATCDCDKGFAGPFCDQCAGGMVGFPSCVTPCKDDKGCDDGNGCTADSCSATVGCVHLPLKATCSDGDACTEGDACVGKECKGAAADCEDGNACTKDSCAAQTGCVHLASGATVCDDGNPCTAKDACDGKTCKGGGALDCDDGNVCTTDSCDPKTKGGCTYVVSGAICSDGDPCSAGASCSGATCVSLGKKDCDDGNPCTVDACDNKGACTNTLAAVGTSCDDDNLCTTGEVCDAKGGCGSGATLCNLAVSKGLAAHYSAGFAVTLAFGSDKRVQSWKDLSSHKRDLSAVDAKKAPLVATGAIHGRRGVRFAGSSGLTAAKFGVSSAMSVFAVFCVESGAKLGSLVRHGAATPAWTLGPASGATKPTLGLSAGTGSAAVALDHKGLGSTKQGKDACFVAAARVSATARDLQLIGTETVSQSGKGQALAKTTAALLLGADDKGLSGGVVLGEVLTYDRAVSDAERDSITAYLRTAWGFDPPKPDFGWYDATDLSTLVTNKDKRVTLWKDKSGLGRDAAAASTKTAPVYFKVGTSNGRPALRFDGSAVRLQTKSVPTASQMTIFAVFEMDKPQPWGCVFAQGHDTWFSIRKTEFKQGYVNFQIAKSYVAPAVPLPLSAWKLWTGVHSAKQTTFYNDPSKPVTVAAGPINAGNEKLSIGNAHVGNESLGGFIAEIRAYGRALAPSDVAYVESLLRRRYGL